MSCGLNLVVGDADGVVLSDSEEWRLCSTSTTSMLCLPLRAGAVDGCFMCQVPRLASAVGFDDRNLSSWKMRVEVPEICRRSSVV